MEVSKALKTFAEQKAEKLTRYYDRIKEIEVIFDNKKETMRVEMIVNADHKRMFIAHHDEDDAYACIDGCVAKLETAVVRAQKEIPQPQASGRGNRHGRHPPDGLLNDGTAAGEF